MSISSQSTNCSQSLITQANGGHRPLGWARMVTMAADRQVTVKLFGDLSGYGRFPYGVPFAEGFVFTADNTPLELLQYISKIHFTISRKTIHNKLNFSPAVLTCQSRNGIFVNKVFVPAGGTHILQHGDYIKMLRTKSLFQFIDDREFDTSEIPNKITHYYHIDGRIGKGAQSTVRLIHRRNSQVKCAMKIISTKQFESETNYSYQKRVQHMRDELQSMKQLRHDNIIRFIDAAENDTHLNIIMEFAEGGDLLSYLKTFPGYCLPEEEAKFCFYQICEGLRYIHKKNIAHRDLKCENVFVVNFGKEKIMKIGDFGFSKNADDHLTTQLGTKVFFPPEIQERSGEYTLKADIWTLGCLFYAAFTGAYPFHTRYAGSLSQQIREASVNFNRRHFRLASDDIQNLISYMLQVDPDQRPDVDFIMNFSPWFKDQIFIDRYKAFKEALAAAALAAAEAAKNNNQ